jgi:hypothetical protein
MVASGAEVVVVFWGKEVVHSCIALRILAGSESSSWPSLTKAWQAMVGRSAERTFAQSTSSNIHAGTPRVVLFTKRT